MRGKWFFAAFLTASGVLAWSGTSRGGDTVRLNGTESAPTQRLVDDGQGADTVRVWHRGYGWGGWGYRGFGWGGFYRPYYGLGWGYGGFYRPYYGFGLGYGGLGYGLGWGGLGYGLGWGGYGLGYGLGYGGFYPGFGIGYGGFFPCAGTTAGVYTLNMPAATLGTPRSGGLPPRDGTFPYDGGPTSNPVPSRTETPPSSTPAPRSVPLEGRSVSLPKAAPKWSYPAYGETARRTAPASERTYLTRGTLRTGSR